VLVVHDGAREYLIPMIADVVQTIDLPLAASSSTDPWTARLLAMHVHVVTIFPELFASPLTVGIPKRARDAGLLRISLVDLREFTHDRHRTTDDAPTVAATGW